MYGRRLRFTFLRCASLCLCLCAVPVYSQILQEETLAGPDAHETAENTTGYLFGEWGGVRTRLLERGVKLDLHSISDSLWNIKSQQNERSRDRGHRFGHVSPPAGVVFPCYRCLADRRQSRLVSGPRRQSQLDCQHEYISPGFLVVPEDLVEEPDRGSRGPVRGSRFLRRPKLREVFRGWADRRFIGQFIQYL